MKVLFGVLLIIGSVFVGLYLGLWLFFIGGIVDVIEGIKATPVDSLAIAFGIAKIWAASFVGWVSFGITFVFGVSLLGS